jgi:molybdopterin molybdotransferase
VTAAAACVKGVDRAMPGSAQMTVMSVSPEPIQRVSRLVPLREVEARIDAIAGPVTAREIDLEAALGRVLAADVTVGAPAPSAAIALTDGWAVNSDQVADAGPYVPVPLVPPPAWVEVGEPLPATADAVLAPDAVVTMAGLAEAHASATAGDGALAAGADADQRTPLRRAGTRLRALDVAALRAAAVTRVSVRVPRLRLVSTNARREAGDFVGALIRRAIEREGGQAEHAGPALEDALRDDSPDGVIAIGGTGAGRQDTSIRTLVRIGRLEMHGIGIRPGETGALGTVGSRPVLLLPGRLDAALAAWLILGRRLLARLTGSGGDEPATSERLVRKVASTVGLAEIVPVARGADGVEPLASGYLSLQALARADGWILVPPDSEGFAAGSMVEVRSFP